MLNFGMNKELVRQREVFRKETNDIFYSLSRLLMTLSVAILSILPTLLSNKLESQLAKYAMIVVLLASLISILAGIAQHYRDYEVFKSYTRYLHYSATNTKTLSRSDKKYFKVFKSTAKVSGSYNTGKVWLSAQIILTIVSLVALLVVGVGIVNL